MILVFQEPLAVFRNVHDTGAPIKTGNREEKEEEEDVLRFPVIDEQ